MKKLRAEPRAVARVTWMALTAEMNALMARHAALEQDARDLRRLYHEIVPIVRDVRQYVELARRQGPITAPARRRRAQAPKRRPVTRRGTRRR